MNEKLYIPKKMKIDFQASEGSFSGKLAFFRYYNAKNKFLGRTKYQLLFIDVGIPSLSFENVPTRGFCVNKEVTEEYLYQNAYKVDGNVKIWDPRGFEFLISNLNLQMILLSDKCTPDGLSGEYIYAVSGRTFKLIPLNTQSYKAAVLYSDLQEGVIKPPQMIEGASYKTKHQENVVYLGKHKWHTYVGSYDKNHKYSKRSRDSEKFIFIEPKSVYGNNRVFQMGSLDFLAQVENNMLVDDYDELLKVFEKCPNKYGIEELIQEEVEFVNSDYKTFFMEIVNEKYEKMFQTVTFTKGYTHEEEKDAVWRKNVHSFITFHNGVLREEKIRYQSEYEDLRGYYKKDLQEMKLYDLFVKTEKEKVELRNYKL